MKFCAIPLTCSKRHCKAPALIFFDRVEMRRFYFSDEDLFEDLAFFSPRLLGTFSRPLGFPALLLLDVAAFVLVI